MIDIKNVDYAECWYLSVTLSYKQHKTGSLNNPHSIVSRGNFVDFPHFESE